jgi:hypothetical protein
MRLQWITIGTALGMLAWLIPWIYLTAHKPEIFYVLSYTRNTGEIPWTDKNTNDPAANLPNISDYPVQIALRCKIKSWTIAANEGVTDVARTARLRVSETFIDDHTFSCLSSFIRPPYVRLERGPDLH